MTNSSSKFEKKMAKREKQRKLNLKRAQDMRKARLQFVPYKKHDKCPAVNVGCSGWFYWHWRDTFYPVGTPTTQWFAHYIKNFSTVELNAPFYSWPTISTVNGWVRQAQGKNIIYTVKVSELITHIKKFVNTKTLIKDFYYIADILGPRMGCFLFQLPPSYSYTPARLKLIVSQLDKDRKNVVEFRHKSWWNKTVFSAFNKAGIIFCSTSAPNLPDSLVKTTDDIYVRFHGVTKWYRYDYKKEELNHWARKIKDSGAKRIWAYFNNDREGYSIKNAKQLLKQLKSVKL